MSPNTHNKILINSFQKHRKCDQITPIIRNSSSIQKSRRIK